MNKPYLLIAGEHFYPSADEGVGYGEYSVGWNEGFNNYRNTLMEKLK